MNFLQKLALCLLIIVTLCYLYFSYFHKTEIHIQNKNNDYSTNYNPLNQPSSTIKEKDENSILEVKNIKIFIVDKSGKIRSVNRVCDNNNEKSCFEFAIKELVKGPSKWEKSAGFSSEIPPGTKVLSIRESAGNILVDLSSDFETGGGTESTYCRIKQVIKTAKANTSSPVYLYINGRQAKVIGGEGLMIKQPLNEDSLDD